jgi:actin-related protein 6
MNWTTNSEMRLVVDNGSWKIRGCTASPTQNNSTPITYFNMMATSKKGGNNYTGEDIPKILDESNYRYTKPHVRGVLVNFDSEIEIWHKMFEKFYPDKCYKNSSITMSVPPVQPTKVKEKSLELLFELYGFNAVCPMTSAQALQSYYGENDEFRNSSPIRIIVESGHSCTNIIPMFDGEIIKSSIRRLDAGGKLLTKLLMQMISVRQFKMEGYFMTINKIKEDVCYIEKNIQLALKSSFKNKIHYV